MRWDEGFKTHQTSWQLEAKYRDCGNKPLEHFQRGYRELKEISKAVYHTITGSSNSKAMEVPYRVVFLIARAGNSHTIGEELILPEAKKIVNIMLREKTCKEMNAISLSNNTV